MTPKRTQDLSNEIILSSNIDPSAMNSEDYLVETLLRDETKKYLLDELNKNKDEHKARIFLTYSSPLLFVMVIAACFILPNELAIGVIIPMLGSLGLIISFYFRKE
jgi:hypothetical protein